MKAKNILLERLISIYYFFDELILDSDHLIIPHPQIQNRNFVLIPMLDISPNFVHPKINEPIENLLKKSNDNSEVKKIKNNNYYIPFWNRYSFISIEGNNAFIANDTSPDGLKDDGFVVYENSLSLITHLY